ncbi:unnamed protein product [Rodentolepis nana]|uniref:Laminin EGF-like domain-containing protein n=1 Tax=Rodentolepis nana TaxID=102285 RepID=A0A0R3TYA3_RODNA|nr:unnamed protein product [Rodentolepis nana]
MKSGLGTCVIAPCNCNPGGSHNNIPQCDPYTGDCTCKANVIGRTCDRCKPGTYGMMDNDPLGCKQCFCSGHSSECTLGREVDGQIVPRLDTESGGSSPSPPVGYIEGMWVECIVLICEGVLPSNRVRYLV